MSSDDDWDLSDDAAPGEESAPQLYYGSVDEFVREFLIHAYRRRINGSSRFWAAEWWKTEEAVMRLEALWRAWEHLRLDPALGMSVWWRDHADHHMAMLMATDGPFAGEEIKSESNRNRDREPLPYIAPPPGLFPDVREELR